MVFIDLREYEERTFIHEHTLLDDTRRTVIYVPDDSDKTFYSQGISTFFHLVPQSNACFKTNGYGRLPC